MDKEKVKQGINKMVDDIFKNLAVAEKITAVKSVQRYIQYRLSFTHTRASGQMLEEFQARQFVWKYVDKQLNQLVQELEKEKKK